VIKQIKKQSFKCTLGTSELWREGNKEGAKRAIKEETQSISVDYQFLGPTD
jgi:hypothetical protein